MLHWPGARGRLAVARPDSKFVLLAQGAAQLEWRRASSKPLRVVGVVARGPRASALGRQGAVGGGRGCRGDRPSRSDNWPGNARITVRRTRQHGWSEAAASRRPGAGADGVSTDASADHHSDSVTRADRDTSGIRKCAPDHRSRRAGDASGAHSRPHGLLDHHRLPNSTRSQSSRFRRRRNGGLEVAGEKERAAGQLAGRGVMRQQHPNNTDQHRLVL